MSWPIKDHAIAKLFLDQENIRTPISNKDQSALIQDMFENEDAFEIAKSYAQNGVFPDEFPIVVEENKKLIVIEGNRRLSALKAIFEPDLVPKWSNRISALKADKIKSIRVVIAPNRDAAIKHIANKHTVNYKKPWKPLRQAYFYKSQIENGKSVEKLIEEFPDHNVVRFIKMLEIHHLAKSLDLPPDASEKVHNERKFPITNLERFIDDTNVIDFLGIEFDKSGRVKGNVPKKEFEKGFKRIVEDIASGYIDSRKFNKGSERKAYIKGFPDANRPDKSKKGSFKSKDFDEAAPKPKPSKPTTKSKKVPKGLFFQSDTPFNLSSDSLHLMYNELKNIDVEKFPNATHDLLRSFLECSTVFFLKHTGEFESLQKSPKHNPKLSEMITFIGSENCTSIEDESIKQIMKQVKADWTESYSIERMNMINHNSGWASTERDVRGAWAKLEPYFKVILNPN